LGNTHYATEDISFLQTMSNNVVLSLAGAFETWQPICGARMIDGPVCVRIGRGDVTLVYGENQGKVHEGTKSEMRFDLTTFQFWRSGLCALPECQGQSLHFSGRFGFQQSPWGWVVSKLPCRLLYLRWNLTVLDELSHRAEPLWR
jgi:hypothetical protein